ncbi:hypothetical protein BGZ59_007811 [Podila verticillata]|nr:hypothetical protein BGZ59_007811 [Podila verticillata]
MASGPLRGGSRDSIFPTDSDRRTDPNLEKDLAPNKNGTPAVIEMVKIPEFRTSIFC